MFLYPARKLKAVCEDCGRTPHAPRRRCPQCDQLVCVSNCWNKKVGHCNSCAATFLPGKIATNSKTISKSTQTKYQENSSGCLYCRKKFKFPIDAGISHESKTKYCENCFRSFYGWY